MEPAVWGCGTEGRDGREEMVLGWKETEEPPPAPSPPAPALGRFSAVQGTGLGTLARTPYLHIHVRVAGAAAGVGRAVVSLLDGGAAVRRCPLPSPRSWKPKAGPWGQGQPHPSRPSAAGDEETYLWTRTCPRLRPALNFVGTELGVSPMARPHTWLLGGWLQSCGEKLGGWCGQLLGLILAPSTSNPHSPGAHLLPGRTPWREVCPRAKGTWALQRSGAVGGALRPARWRNADTPHPTSVPVLSPDCAAPPSISSVRSEGDGQWWPPPALVPEGRLTEGGSVDAIQGATCFPKKLRCWFLEGGAPAFLHTAAIWPPPP